MAVYIDHPTMHNGRLWCHLTADTQDELHEFAIRLGSRREWFQDKGYKWHYDIPARGLQQALDLGAKLITSREMVRLMQARRG